MRKTFLLFTLFALLAMSVLAQGDVIVKQESTASTMGMMEMEIKTTEYVRADMSTSEQTTLAKGGMVAMFGGGEREMKSTTINRLDKNLLWDVDFDEKSYMESKLDAYKEYLSNASEAEYEDETGDADEDPEKYEWTVDVQTKDKPVDINGFSCKGIIAEAKGVNKEDPNEKMNLYFEYWYSKDVEGYDELKQYSENYSKITGVDIIESQKEAGEVFAQYGDQLGKMFEKVGEADGYPIKTVITLKGSGGEMAAIDEEELDESQVPAGVMNMMKGMMGGKEKSEDGMSVVFSMTNVVKSIEKKGVDDSKFEVPEGFTKISTEY